MSASKNTNPQIIGYTDPGGLGDPLAIYAHDVQDPNEYLTFHAVPKAYCDYLASVFSTQKQKVLLDYGFKFLSHLLASVRESDRQGEGHLVHQAVRMKLAGCANTTTLAKWTQALLDNGVIEIVQQGGWGNRNDFGKLLASTYRVAPQLFNRLRSSVDMDSFQTAAYYRKRERAKSRPVTKLHHSFSLIKRDKILKDVILQLQKRPLHCDLPALRTYARSLPGGEWDKWRHIISTLTDAKNYATYRVAASGRLQTANINLQGVPRKLRKFFYPSADDLVFLDLDYRSQEPWIVSHLSGDQALSDILKTGDIYKLVADKFGLDRNAQAKPMVNSYNYGAGVETIARAVAQVSERTDPGPSALIVAQEFKVFMAQTFPDAARWTRERVSEIKRSGEAMALGGFKRTGIMLGDAATKGVNHIVQGSGAYMLRLILHELDAALGDIGRVVLSIHDGLLLEVRRDNVELATNVAREVMGEASRKVLEGTTILVEVTQGWKDKGEDPSMVNIRPARATG